MKLSVYLALLLLSVAFSAPTANDDKQVFNNDFLDERDKIYEGLHNIVKIYTPLNQLNFNEDNDSNGSTFLYVPYLFFVTADIQEDKKLDQGLYMMFGSEVTKLLDHGRDMISPLDDDSEAVYFATNDGIYQYNAKERKAEKYGTVDEDLIAIEMGYAADGIYVLTADKKVYKVTEDGTKKELVHEIKDAEQIVLDYSGYFYYVDSAKNVFIFNDNSATEITRFTRVSLPENFSNITLVRPFFATNSGIPVIIDKEIYYLNANGNLEDTQIKIDDDITAYSIESFFFQYYSRDNKIYEHNALELLKNSIMQEFTTFTNELYKITTKPSSEFLSANNSSSAGPVLAEDHQMSVSLAAEQLNDRLGFSDESSISTTPTEMLTSDPSRVGSVLVKTRQISGRMAAVKQLTRRFLLNLESEIQYIVNTFDE